ncbi:MAG: acylphosphatase [Deltaproteobacteria bacterium]
MDRVRARVLIIGLVQGVYFRANTRDCAKKHGVSGWVRNNSNGTVEAMLEGNGEDVKRVIEWCRIGPASARIDRCDVQWQEYTGEFNDFVVLAGHASY